MNHNKNYDDIIHLSHHVSSSRHPMSMIERAAQFLPFAALSGYGELIVENTRLTEEKIELDDIKKEELNAKLNLLKKHMDEHPFVTMTYFKKDEKKEGGIYIRKDGHIIKIEEHFRYILMNDETMISFDDLIEIDSELFLNYNI